VAYAMVAAVALYLSRALAETAGPSYAEWYKLRAYHAQGWTLLAGVLLVVAVLNP
jgi:drug/metabolite transporter superfamily protein YnfA